MSDYEGTLPRLVVSRTLWLVFAWPLAGLAWQWIVARPGLARANDADAVRRAQASSRIGGFGCIVLAATATLGHAILLGRLPVRGGALFEPLVRGGRYGAVEAGIDLLLDARGLAACGLACVVALAAAAVLATRPVSERGWRPWAWLQLALAGCLLSFLGDGFVTVSLGWTLAAAAGAWVAGWHDAGAGVVVATRGAAALAGLLVGAALLFWGLGGGWDDEGYTPDPHPRFAAVHGGVGPGDASITMTSLPGALVYLDDARTSSLRAPFVGVPLAAGPHAIRMHFGDGAQDASVRAEAASGDRIALVPLGPTLSFHTMADELSVRDAHGTQGVRRAAEDRLAPGGIAVMAGALLILLAAGAAMSAWSLPTSAPGALVATAAGVTTSALGPFLLIRLAFLLPSAPQAARVIAAVGLAILVAAVSRALRFTGGRRWSVFAAGAPPGLTLVAWVRGDTVAAFGVMVGGGLAACAVCLVAAAKAPATADVGDGAVDDPGRGSLDDALLASLPARLGELVASMERWVVGAVASAVDGTARVAAWTVARLDDHVVSTPGDAVASGLERAARTVQPWLGAPLARVGWGLLAAAGLLALVHAAWPGH
jgi:hypothetical protein